MARKSSASILKSKGLIPAWDLRKKLSRGQKSWITKQARAFAEVIKAPKKFSTIPVKGKRQKAEARAAGFGVGPKRATVKGKARRLPSGHIVQTEGDTTREYYFANASNFQEVWEQVSSIELAHNQLWQLQIGENTLNISFRDINEAQRYLADIKWENPDNERKQIAFILVTEAHGIFGDE